MLLAAMENSVASYDQVGATLDNLVDTAFQAEAEVESYLNRSAV